MESRAAFEQNLARLRRRHAALARALEHAPAGSTQVVVGPRGARTVSSQGTLLASAYDPEREGERLAEEMAREPADLLVAIGFGLGHHLEAYRRRNPCPLIVYEPSAERLRAALAARPGLTLLGLRDVALTLDPEQIGRLLGAFYTPGLRIRVFPHPSVLRLDAEATRDAVQRVARAKDSLDITARTRVGMAGQWAGLTVDNLAALLRTPSFGRLRRAFAGAPAVVAAAGPSLDRQLPLLREHAGRVLVIAIGQTLGTLRRAGIEPDLVHVVESQDVTHQLEKAGGTEDLNLVLLPSCHPRLFEIPVRTRFVAYPHSNQIARWIASALGEKHWTHSGGTVAQTAVLLAAELGLGPILLVGQDLAYTGGRVYAADSAYADVGFEVQEGGSFVLTSMAGKQQLLGRPARERTRRRELVWVPGWGGENVPTSKVYASFREQYREIAALLSARRVRVVNCTEGGALIPGLEHVPFSEALAACPQAPVEGARRLQACHDAHEPPSPRVFEPRLASARRELDAVERDARAGRSRARRAGGALRRARAPERKIEILQGVGRYDKRLKQRLGRLDWVDALVQPGLHRALASMASAEAAAPSPERAIEESAALFETTLEGVERARELLARLEERLAAIGEA